MRAAAAALAAVSLMVLACGDPAESPVAGETPAVSTATPGTLVGALTVSDPVPATSLKAGEISYHNAYVLDVDSGLIYAISRDSEMPVGAIQWISDDTVQTEDGLSAPILHDVAATSNPVATITPTVMPDVPESADGLWSAERNLAISGITVTERATERRFDVPNTDDYQWAPAGHLIATGGGWCGGGRVSIVDPAAGTIMQITPGGSEGHGVVYVWRPDGLALALDLFNEGQALVLVDATTGEMTTLIDPPEYVGEFVPLEWNPSGTHLLFRIHGGRDCSN